MDPVDPKAREASRGLCTTGRGPAFWLHPRPFVLELGHSKAIWEISAYIDTLIVLGHHPPEIKREIEEVIEEIKTGDPDLKTDVEMFMYLPGAEIDEDEIIYEVVKRAHREVHGQNPEVYTEGWTSDASAIARYGVPTINYGPSGRIRSGVPGWDPNIGEHVSLEDLYETTKVYASLLLDVSGKLREEILPHIQRKIAERRKLAKSTVTL